MQFANICFPIEATRQPWPPAFSSQALDRVMSTQGSLHQVLQGVLALQDRGASGELPLVDSASGLLHSLDPEEGIGGRGEGGGRGGDRSSSGFPTSDPTATAVVSRAASGAIADPLGAIADLVTREGITEDEIEEALAVARFKRYGHVRLVAPLRPHL